MRPQRCPVVARYCILTRIPPCNTIMAMIATQRTKRLACVIALFGALSISALAQITTLVSFDKTNGRDPGYPAAPFAQAANGDLYGTTAAGGANDEGTVFKMTLAGKLVTLYSFCSQSSCGDGAVANAG